MKLLQESHLPQSPGTRPAFCFHTRFTWLCSPGSSSLHKPYQTESRVGSWTTVLTQVTGTWWASYPLGGSYKHTQLLFQLCPFSLQHECICISGIWESTMSTVSCWMPGLLRQVQASSCCQICSATNHCCFSSGDTSVSVYEGSRPLISEHRLFRHHVIPRCLKKRQAYTPHRLLASGCNILLLATYKRKFSPWIGSFWREGSFLLTLHVPALIGNEQMAM